MQRPRRTGQDGTAMDLTRAYQSMGLEVPYQQFREAWKLGGEPKFIGSL